MTTDTAPPEVPELEDPEEQEEGGQMTLLEHLLELRSRVMWMSIAVLGGMLLFFMPPIGFRFMDVLLEPGRQAVPDFQLQFIEPMENVFVYFRMAFLGGITVAMPMVVYHLLRFITPALTRNEKRWIFPIVFGGTFAFVTGLAFAYFVVIPLAFGFLLSFGTEFAEPNLRIDRYMSFVVRLLLVLGIVFQTPLLILALAKFRVVTWRKLIGWWRYAVVVAFVIAAIATPTIDPVTQTLVAGPIIILYGVGIGLAWLVQRNQIDLE
jgi:sec-independent protein translocase protein TatC